MSENFEKARCHFPIRYQDGNDHSIDAAVALLRAVTKKDNNYHRARAWLSYACMTAVLDDWSRADCNSWGNELSQMSDDEVKAFAVSEAAAAVAALKGDDYEYDALWAEAFALLNTGEQVDAVQRYRDALTRNDLGKETYRDIHLLAEAADGFVYAGLTVSAREQIEKAKTAVARKKKDAPDWFHWVDAWVSFAEAAEAANRGQRNRKLAETINALRQMRRAGNDVADDFDAEVLCAVAHHLQGQPGDPGRARRCRDRHSDESRNRRGGRDWSARKELARSPFRFTSGSDGRVYREFKDALDELYGS